MSERQSLQRLLRPKTVAVFGGDSAAEVIRQCRAVGFSGEIWAVNPGRSELAGVPCVPGVDELPGVPDASFIATPPRDSLQIIRELAERGAPGAVCFTAGFAETDAEGQALQQQLREAAGEMAIIGPNCHGFLNYLDGVALWPDEHGGQRAARGIALISQSGNLAINLTMQLRGLDFSYVISIGNNSTLGLHEYIDVLLDDPRVTAIGLHIEGLQEVTEFSKVAISALRKRIPIAVLKTGRSTLGAEVTLSHTGSLAGSDRLYSALFKRVGIARCDTVAQFLETLKFLSVVGSLAENTLGSMSCSGGDASLVADCADRLSIEMPKLSSDSQSRLQEVLGPMVRVANPLDYHLYIWGNYEKLNDCFTAVLGNRYACTVLVLDYPTGDNDQTANWELAERALTDAVKATGQRAVVVSSLPETLPASVRERLKSSGIAPMQGIEDCLFAHRAAVRVGLAQREADNILPVMQPAAMSGMATPLNECRSKQALAEFGVAIPDGRLCNEEEAVAAAEELGYPVVLKAVSNGLVHKSEAHAVAVNIEDEKALRAAIRPMAAHFDRFLIEKMVQSTVAELIVGVSRDATFGLTLLVGTGGTLVELLDDTASLLLPVRRSEIRDTIRGLKAGTLIAGYRGSAAGDLETVIDTIEAVARYACEHNDVLYEIDVNPLLVTPGGAVAVDAFISKHS